MDIDILIDSDYIHDAATYMNGRIEEVYIDSIIIGLARYHRMDIFAGQTVPNFWQGHIINPTPYFDWSEIECMDGSKILNSRAMYKGHIVRGFDDHRYAPLDKVKKEIELMYRRSRPQNTVNDS